MLHRSGNCVAACVVKCGLFNWADEQRPLMDSHTDFFFLGSIQTALNRPFASNRTQYSHFPSTAGPPHRILASKTFCASLSSRLANRIESEEKKMKTKAPAKKKQKQNQTNVRGKNFVHFVYRKTISNSCLHAGKFIELFAECNVFR